MLAHGPSGLLIDCDTGIDDAIALLYAVASEDAEMAGISCVAGNVELDDVVRNTLAVLELAGRPDLEVAAGCAEPLRRPLRTASDTHGPTGLGYAESPDPGTVAGPRHGAELIVELARSRPGELSLVTLGPLTNVAVALEREPDLPRLLRGLFMMVGAYRTPGNTAPTMEWNAGVDPEALAATLAGWEAVARDGSLNGTAGASRPVAFGLDVTEKAMLTPAHLERLAAAAGGAADPIVRFVSDALRFYFEFHSRNDGFYGAYIHDALVVAAALDPSLARTEPVRVEIELTGRWTTGETVTDWRQAWGEPPNVDVAVDVDVGRFFDRLIGRLAALVMRRASVG